MVTSPRVQTSVSSVTSDKPKLKDFKKVKTARSKDRETASGRQEKEMEREGNVGFLGRSTRQCVSRPMLNDIGEAY